MLEPIKQDSETLFKGVWYYGNGEDTVTGKGHGSDG